MSKIEMEAPWYETVAIYVGVGALYLAVYLGIPFVAETFGGEWLVVVVAAIIGILVLGRTVRWAVRRLCDFSGKQCPEFARPNLPVKWEIDADGVTLREVGERGESMRVRYDELRAVFAETTSGGPFVEDFFYVLVDDENALKVPLGVACEQELTDHIFGLPGFDHGAVIEASASVEDAIFVCWESAPTDGSLES